MWDLQRNGGSVAATTERILGGRGLEVVSFPCVLRAIRVLGGCAGSRKASSRDQANAAAAGDLSKFHTIGFHLVFQGLQL